MKIAQDARWNRMDTSRTGSYVALKLTEIQERFAELVEEDLADLSLEDPELDASLVEGCNPYDRN